MGLKRHEDTECYEPNWACLEHTCSSPEKKNVTHQFFHYSVYSDLYILHTVTQIVVSQGSKCFCPWNAVTAIW